MSTYGPRQPLIDTFITRNSQLNLSAIRDPEGIYSKHILDSLELNTALDFSMHSSEPTTHNPQQAESQKLMHSYTHTLLDVGTGGGFPLLPLAISNPQFQCYGLDTRQKKCKAVQAIADELGLTNVKTIRARAEEHTQKYDIVTARAVSHASKLFPRVKHLVKKGGYLCLYKQLTQDEDTVILSTMDQFGFELEALHHYHLNEEDEVERVIYILEKIK